jgi:hypothetical protein
MFYFAEYRLSAKDNKFSNQSVYALMKGECKTFHVFFFPYVFTALLMLPILAYNNKLTFWCNPELQLRCVSSLDTMLSCFRRPYIQIHVIILSSTSCTRQNSARISCMSHQSYTCSLSVTEHTSVFNHYSVVCIHLSFCWVFHIMHFFPLCFIYTRILLRSWLS